MAAEHTVVPPPPPSDTDARASESTANNGILDDDDDDDDNAVVKDDVEEDLFGGKNDDGTAAAVDATSTTAARSTLLLRDNPPPPPLPPGWHLVESRSASNCYYYFHRDTGECRWEYPPSSSRATAADAMDEVGGVARSESGEGGAEGEMDVMGAESASGIASSSSSVAAAAAAVRGILKRSMSSSDHPPAHRTTAPENGDGTAVVKASSSSSSSSRQNPHPSSSSSSHKRARADHRGEGAGGGGGDASSPAEPREVRCLHILRKHRDSKRPSSWRMAKVTCTKEQAISDIRELMAILEGAANSNDGNELRATFEELARTESDCSSAKRGGDLGFFGRKKMNAAFERASFRLGVGEMSDVVDTSSGVHVILRLA
jgi:NIMA-interacting peptidyl-prolyl cis-trans isomerase 1